MDTYPFTQPCPFTEPPELRRLRETAPVCPVTLANGATAWLVSNRDSVRTVLNDDRFSRLPARAAAAPTNRPGGSFDFGMSIADPTGHARWRRAANTVFGVANAESMRSRIGGLVEDVLDELAKSDQPADLMSEFAFVVPMRVLCALFDVPDEHRPPFHDWASSLRRAGNSMAAFGTAMHTLHTAVAELVALQRVQPGNGLLAALLATGEPALSDAEAVATVLLLTIAGYETTAVQFGNGFLALCQHPDQLALLKSDESLIGPAVEEILRYAQAGTGFAGSTTTTEDVALSGVVIPAGATVFASLDSSARDEAHVTDPQEFNLRSGSANRHITFGSGARHCLGAPLARVELQEGFGRLLRRFPNLRLAMDVDDVRMSRNMFSHFPQALPITW